MAYILTCREHREEGPAERAVGRFDTLIAAIQAASDDAERQGLTIPGAHALPAWGEAEPEGWSGATDDGRLRYNAAREES